MKSPLYVSVILGGISPLDICSTYFAATLSGVITASKVLLTPVISSLYAPLCLLASARVANSPATAALAKTFESEISLLMLPTIPSKAFIKVPVSSLELLCKSTSILPSAILLAANTAFLSGLVMPIIITIDNINNITIAVAVVK
ncbi:hypothetical protein SDC9_152213 [bioreactor metagenome]|uniref:Uncharacterized protein n=1 Tax=bioreactor metagenome TaxID=1076179 RepID=A0A645EWY8_9ZZZZ